MLAGVAVRNADAPIAKGAYRGVRSRVVVHVVGAGGVVFPNHDTRIAFEALKPTPVTLDASAKDVPDLLNEVFVAEDEVSQLQEGAISSSPFSNRA